MKKNRLKIILLIILSVMMIYIWWGNVQTFSQSSYNAQTDQSSLKQTDDSIDKPRIEYRKPKLNPFKRYSNTQQLSKPNPQRQQQLKIAIPKLSTAYILQGIISEKNSSQAIINDNNGNSTILSKNEQINSWTLTNIDKHYIIFKNEKLYDTLWLQTIK